MPHAKLIIATIALLSMFACTSKSGYDSYLASTPEQAIMNISEKEKVLQHYAHPADSLRKRAALFLLEHIAVHCTHENNTHDRFYRALDQLDVSHTNYANIFPLISSIWNSVSCKNNATDILLLQTQQAMIRGYLNFITTVYLITIHK